MSNVHKLASSFNFVLLFLHIYNLINLSRCEFNIPFNEIEISQVLRKGNRKQIIKIKYNKTDTKTLSQYNYMTPHRPIVLDLHNRGKWHGNVTIHVYHQLDRYERTRFWKDVKRLSQTRHENIILFMGVSIEPPNFCIVTSHYPGPSLYDVLYLRRTSIEPMRKLQLLHQLSLTLAYLHSRQPNPVVVRSLNSHNLFVGHRLTLSLLDHSHTDVGYVRPDCIPITHQSLAYLAPELILAIDKASNQIDGHVKVDSPTTSSPYRKGYSDSVGYLSEQNLATNKCRIASNLGECRENNHSISLPDAITYNGEEMFSKQDRIYYIYENLFDESTDTYAFGTIVYELHTHTLPFVWLDRRVWMKRVGQGLRDPVNSRCIPIPVRECMLNCWSHFPTQRPMMQQISEQLSSMTGYFKKKAFSKSQPLLSTFNSCFRRYGEYRTSIVGY